MIYLFEDWKIIEEYGTEQQRIYQILAEGEKTIVKVVAGDVGFQKEFDNPKDPLLSRIKEFCKDFVKLDKNIKVDNFFR